MYTLIPKSLSDAFAQFCIVTVGRPYADLDALLMDRDRHLREGWLIRLTDDTVFLVRDGRTYRYTPSSGRVNTSDRRMAAMLALLGWNTDNDDIRRHVLGIEDANDS